MPVEPSVAEDGLFLNPSRLEALTAPALNWPYVKSDKRGALIKFYVQ